MSYCIIIPCVIYIIVYLYFRIDEWLDSYRGIYGMRDFVKEARDIKYKVLEGTCCVGGHGCKDCRDRKECRKECETRVKHFIDKYVEMGKGNQDVSK